MRSLLPSLSDYQDTYVIGIPLKTNGNERDDTAIMMGTSTYASGSGAYVKKFWYCSDIEAMEPPEGYQPIAKGSLNECSGLDTVILVSHGNANQMGWWPRADQLAEVLEYWGGGVLAVGTLRLAACLVGKKGYVEELKAACMKRNIAVKKFQAFSESMVTTTSWSGTPIEVSSLWGHIMGKEENLVELEGNW